ncbi:MAG: macro domain-containing protein [Cellvibrionaceae bacterium]
MAKRILHGVIIECVLGDIADQPDMDAIVNAANADLKAGVGVAGAIHSAAGLGLEVECRPLAPIEPGEAVITRAHRLPNRQIIHCLGPVFGRDDQADELLAFCYRKALCLAEANGIGSIVFPPIARDASGDPVEAEARIAFAIIDELLPELPGIELVRFTVSDSITLELYTHALEGL